MNFSFNQLKRHGTDPNHIGNPYYAIIKQLNKCFPVNYTLPF